LYFQHSPDMWASFPTLVPGVVYAEGIRANVSAADRAASFHEAAAERLAAGPEGEFPEIQAWRRAFSAMGLKPTQYRCASESLLRRFRKEHALPQIHPLIDICNAISLAFATPVAVFDIAHIDGGITVRHANADETYLTFAGETENPESGEVIFADNAGQAHCRRWTNRQSRLSAVSDTTATVLIVAEALHKSASTDIPKLTATIADELAAIWMAPSTTAILTANSPRIEFTQ
jgi:DNA/RNA-binding domain of Phe-tRNA-synthetase-like protein